MTQSSTPPDPPETSPLAPEGEAPLPEPTPAEILAALEIAEHPIALKWAVKWNTILQAVSEGAVERDACAMARVSWGTWMKWKEKGRGNKRVRPIVSP